jgi:hypothetical protein
LGVILAGVLAVSVTGLAGCSGNPKITKTFTPTATESHRSETPQAVAEYQPATETSPAKNVPVPKYPEAAKAKTKAGQKAFIEYWFKTYNYAFETGDTKPLQAVSGKDCEFCDQVVSKSKEIVLSSKTWRISAGTNIVRSTFEYKGLAEGSEVWDARVHDARIEFWDTGGRSKKYKTSNAAHGPARFWTVFRSGRWFLAGTATLDGD